MDSEHRTFPLFQQLEHALQLASATAAGSGGADSDSERASIAENVQEATRIAEEIRQLLAEDKLRKWFRKIEALTDEVRAFQASPGADGAQDTERRVDSSKTENGGYRKLVDAVQAAHATRAGLIQWFQREQPDLEAAAVAFRDKVGSQLRDVESATTNSRKLSDSFQERYNKLSAQSAARFRPELREVRRRSSWLTTMADQHDGTQLKSSLAALADLAARSERAEHGLQQLEQEFHNFDGVFKQAEDLSEYDEMLTKASQSMNWLKYLEKHWALAAAAGTVLVLLIVCIGRAIVLWDAARQMDSLIPFDHFSLASLPPDVLSSVVGAVTLALAAIFVLRNRRKSDIKRLLASADGPPRRSTFLFSMNDAPPMRALLIACALVVGLVASVQLVAQKVLSSGARTFELSKSASENYGERCLDVHRSGTIADRIIVVRKPAQILALAPSDIAQTRSGNCTDPALTAGELLVAMEQVTANALRMAETMVRINQPVPPQLVRVETEVHHRFANRPAPAPTPDLTSIGAELAKVALAIDKLSAEQEQASDVHLSYQRDTMDFANRLSFRSAELNACISRYGNDAPAWIRRRIFDPDGSQLDRRCEREIHDFSALWDDLPKRPPQIAPKSEPDQQQRAPLIMASAVPASAEHAE